MIVAGVAYYASAFGLHAIHCYHLLISLEFDSSGNCCIVDPSNLRLKREVSHRTLFGESQYQCYSASVIDLNLKASVIFISRQFGGLQSIHGRVWCHRMETCPSRAQLPTTDLASCSCTSCF